MDANPPQPQPSDVATPAMFPGAGFIAGQLIDEDTIAKMNECAERWGWTCRFEAIRHWRAGFVSGVRMVSRDLTSS